MNSINSFVVHSVELDTELAIEEVINLSEKKLGGMTPNAGILFVGIDFDHKLIADELIKHWPNLQLIGCTTDGEFSSVNGYVEDSVILTLLTSENCEMLAAYIDNSTDDLSSECRASYNEATKKLSSEPRLCILLSEVLRINGELVIEELTKASNFKVPIAGGISADSYRYKETKQICNNIVSCEISSYLLLSGDFDFSFGMDSGFEPHGEMGKITKAEGNIIYEINNRPAMKFYTDILGSAAKPTNELPIAIHDEEGVYRFMRTSFENFDPVTGAVTYLGNVPMHNQVRIAMVNRASLIEGAKNSMGKAISTYPPGKKPSLALCFSCSARRVLLGSRTKEEYEKVKELLGEDVTIAGFYTYGEICHSTKRRNNEFHNETFVVVLIG